MGKIEEIERQINTLTKTGAKALGLRDPWYRKTFNIDLFKQVDRHQEGDLVVVDPRIYEDLYNEVVRNSSMSVNYFDNGFTDVPYLFWVDKGRRVSDQLLADETEISLLEAIFLHLAYPENFQDRNSLVRGTHLKGYDEFHPLISVMGRGKPWVTITRAHESIDDIVILTRRKDIFPLG